MYQIFNFGKDYETLDIFIQSEENILSYQYVFSSIPPTLFSEGMEVVTNKESINTFGKTKKFF